jgi:hypothetical protein
MIQSREIRQIGSLSLTLVQKIFIQNKGFAHYQLLERRNTFQNGSKKL